jgi:hypothetical protein
MASAPLFTLQTPTPEEYQKAMLTTISNALIRRGITNPNVSPSSDFYVVTLGVANELSVNASNGILSADQVNPDTATGQQLIDLGAIIGVFPRNAAGSLGNIIANSSAPGLVPAGKQLTDDSGLRYEVTVGGTYAVGDSIPIQALDTGDATNLPEGSSLQWAGAPPFFAPTALVGVGGLINGVDAETEENFRQRVLANEANVPASGNPEHCNEIAEASSPSVQKAFTYPAVQGPGTEHIAVCAAPTATNLRRDINSILMTGTIIPYILGKLPSRSLQVITTVNNVFITMAFGLNLPAAPTASPSGPGGGWLDGTPWPPLNPTGGINVVTVTSSTDSTHFVVNTTVAPIVGVSRVARFDFAENKLYTATVIGYNSGSGVVTLDQPLNDLAMSVGDVIFPQSQNQLQYVAAVLAAGELLGPGEKTTNASALIRGFRHPIPTSSWPSAMGANFLQAITQAGGEVQSAQFNYRNDGTTTVTTQGGNFFPAIPGVVTDPPNIFVPFRFGFYPTP